MSYCNAEGAPRKPKLTDADKLLLTVATLAARKAAGIVDPLAELRDRMRLARLSGGPR